MAHQPRSSCEPAMCSRCPCRSRFPLGLRPPSVLPCGDGNAHIWPGCSQSCRRGAPDNLRRRQTSTQTYQKRAVLVDLSVPGGSASSCSILAKCSGGPGGRSARSSCPADLSPPRSRCGSCSEDRRRGSQAPWRGGSPTKQGGTEANFLSHPFCQLRHVCGHFGPATGRNQARYCACDVCLTQG